MLDISDIEFIPSDDPFRRLVNQDTICMSCTRLGLSATYCGDFRHKEKKVNGFPVIVSCSGYQREIRSYVEMTES